MRIVGISRPSGCGAVVDRPISDSQDTAGGQARQCRRSGARSAGAADPMTPRPAPPPAPRRQTTRSYLDDKGLRGARLGVPRNLAGFHPEVDRQLDEAIAGLKDAGGVIVDHLQLPTAGKFDDAELDVLLYEFKAGLAAYLAARDPSSPPRTLADVIAFNERTRAGDAWFVIAVQRAQRKGPLGEPAYRAARAQCLRMARREGLDLLFQSTGWTVIFHRTSRLVTDMLTGAT